MCPVEVLASWSSGPDRFPLISASWTGRSDRIAFYSSVQLFLLFTVSKLSCDRCYRIAPRVSKGFCQIAIRNDPETFSRRTFNAKSFGCHTSEKCARNSFGCHTYEIASS
jgi:hypothetical protein